MAGQATIDVVFSPEAAVYPVDPRRAGPLLALPGVTPVAFPPDSVRLDLEGRKTLTELAFALGLVSLRNQAAGVVELPKILVTGYGGTTPAGDIRMPRAQRASFVLPRLLTEALDTLQQGLPPDAPRLNAANFMIDTAPGDDRPSDDTAARAGVPPEKLQHQVTVGITLTPEAVAVARLDVLRGRDAELRGGPFDLDAVARRVLRPEDDPADGDLRKEFLGLVAAAEAAGPVRSLAALATAVERLRKGLPPLAASAGSPAGTEAAQEAVSAEPLSDQGDPSGDGVPTADGAASSTNPFGLTGMDRKVAEFVVEGYSNEDIVDATGLPPTVVRKLVTTIYSKMGITASTRNTRRHQIASRLGIPFELRGVEGAVAEASSEPAKAISHENLERLAPQETRVAHLAAEGHTNAEILDILNVDVPDERKISIRTVENHLGKIYGKL